MHAWWILVKTWGGQGWGMLTSFGCWRSLHLPSSSTLRKGYVSRTGKHMTDARLVCCGCPSQNPRLWKSARFWTRGTCSKFFVIEVITEAKKKCGLNFKMELSSHSSWILEKISPPPNQRKNNMGKTTHGNPKRCISNIVFLCLEASLGCNLHIISASKVPYLEDHPT